MTVVRKHEGEWSEEMRPLLRAYQKGVRSDETRRAHALYSRRQWAIQKNEEGTITFKLTRAEAKQVWVALKMRRRFLVSGEALEFNTRLLRKFQTW